MRSENNRTPPGKKLRAVEIALDRQREASLNKLSIAVTAIGLIACSVSSWAQQSLRAAGQDVPPWVVHDQGSQAISGIFVDLIAAIAKDEGAQVQYQTIIFADLIPAVTSGKIDIIATNMAITPERKQLVDFSNPIYAAPTEVVVVRANDPTNYRTLADLKGLPVAAPKGSIQLALLQRTGGFSEIKVYDTQKDAWAAVASGAVKAAVTPGADTVFAAEQGQLSNLRIETSYRSPSSKPLIGFAVQRGNSALLDKINNSLAKLEASGTVEAIFIKYGLEDWVPPR